MKRSMLYALVLLLASSLPSFATVYFENQGDKTGWPNYPQVPQQRGRLENVGSPVYKGSTAIMFEQTYVQSSSSRFHSEVTYYTSQRSGEDRYYGLAMMLDPSWQLTDFNRDVWEQFGTESPSGPWIILRIDRDQMALSAGDVTSGSHSGFTLTKGVWHTAVTRLRMTNPGNLQLWWDGSMKWDAGGNLTAGGSSVRYSAGLYVAYWYDRYQSGLPSGYQNVRRLYQDHYRIASTYAEAEPANWGGGSTPTPTPTPTPVPATPTPTPTPVPGTPTPTPTPVPATPTPTPTPGSGLAGYYRLMARHSGKALVVQSASTANSAAVIQYTYGGANTNDEWELRTIGSGYYRVINRLSGKDMVVASASTAEGAAIVQFTYGGANTNDEWQIVDVGSGYYRIANGLSGKSAEVAGGGTGDGVTVDQRTYSGATYQQFQIVSVP